MSEKALVVVLEHILEEIKKFNTNQLVFMAFLESKVPSIEANTRVEEEVVKAAMDGKDITFDVPKKLKKTKSNPKIDAGAHRISTTTCNQCGGLISWDMRPERKTPLHVDENGHIKGTGDCPEWEGES